MAPQHTTEVTNTSWLAKPAAKVLYLCVAGLLCIALLYHPSAGSATSQATLSLNKQSFSSGSSSAREQSKQCANSATSSMPGRLNRFLQ